MQTQRDRSPRTGGGKPPTRATAREARLDLHEESSTEAAHGCARWPAKLRLLSSRGELVRGRCGATRLCDYCAKLAAVEVSEMLALDAMEGNAPTVWCVLTTRNPDVD